MTGASGFVGRHLTPLLLSQGREVIAVDIHPTSHASAETAEGRTRHELDLRDPVATEALFRAASPDVVVHAAAYGVQVGQCEWGRSFDVNVSASLNVVEAAKRAGVKRVIHMGTSNEYGSREGVLSEDSALEPLTPYGATKAAAFLLCRQRAKELGVHWVELRPFLCFGPGEGEDKFLPSIIIPLLRGEVPRMTGGKQVRDILFVRDLTPLIAKTLEADLPAGVAINLGSGEGRTLCSLAEELLQFFPRASIAFGERAYRDPEVWCQVADISLCRKYLGEPSVRPLCQSLRETIDYYRETG